MNKKKQQRRAVLQLKVFIVEDEEEDFKKILSILIGTKISKDLTQVFKKSICIENLNDEALLKMLLGEKSLYKSECDIIWKKNYTAAATWLKDNTPLFAILDLLIPYKENSESKNKWGNSLRRRCNYRKIPNIVISKYLKKQDILKEKGLSIYLEKEFIFDDIVSFNIKPDDKRKKEIEEERKRLKSLYYTSVIQTLTLNLTRTFRADRVVSNRWKLLNQFRKNFKGIDEIAVEIAKIFNHIDKNENIPFPKTLEKPQKSKCHISNKTEVDEIIEVLLHKPSVEIDEVTPRNYEDYLLDGALNADIIKKQHEIFRRLFARKAKKENTPVRTLESLIFDLFKDKVVGLYYMCKLLLDLTKVENLDENTFWKIINVICKKGGYKEFWEIILSGKLNVSKSNEEVILPNKAIPNLIFTRDSSFIIHNHIFISTMKKDVRKREALILKFIYENHNKFIGCIVHDLNRFDKKNKRKDKEYTIEGGDVILFSQDSIFIGISDRTNLEGILEVAKILFNENLSVKAVISTEAPLAHKRCMHLDTYLGFFNKDYFFVYEDPICIGKNVFSVITKDNISNGPDFFYCDFNNFLSLLRKEPYNLEIPKPIVIKSGGKYEKEHFEDSCNVFVLRPNLYIAYARTKSTIRYIAKKIKKTIDLKKDIPVYLWNEHKESFYESEYDDRRKEWKIKTTNRTYKHWDKIKGFGIIIFEGYELGTARGGPHCMTCPIWRGEE